MDPNTVVLEISSDEEGGWESNINRGISTDGFDDHNWIADLLDEVNRDDCGYNDDNDDDSDEVVVVSEVLPKPKKKVVAKCSTLVKFDDECMVLDHDPDKPSDVRNDDSGNRDEADGDDDDDVLVVSEKGQVACRDYPHSRHLCIKFPFSSTPNQSHCEQCYCYVCDSLAPCVYWGTGSDTLDHCQATDKDDFWKLERQNSRNGSKVDTSLSNQLPAINLVSPTLQNQVTRPNPIRACPILSNFEVPNIINQNQTPFILSTNKYEPSLVSPQQLIRTSSCTIPTDSVHHNYDLSTPLHKPVFKRTVSAGVVPTTNRYSYSSYRDSYRNLSSQPNVVNASVPFSPPNHAFEEPLPRSNSTFDFSPNFHPSLNPDPYMETSRFFQAHTVPLSSQPQGQSSLPNYSIPSEAPQQENQGQRSTVDPKFFHDISWPEKQTNHQPATQNSLLEGATLTNEPSLATGSGGLVDYGFDNWMFNHQPCEPGSMDVSGSYGLNEFSPEPAFIDTGIIFDF